MSKVDETKNAPSDTTKSGSRPRPAPAQGQFEFPPLRSPPLGRLLLPQERKKPKPNKTVAKRPSEQGALLLDCSEVCSLLKISRSTLDRMEKAGTLPGRVKIGGQVRYHRQILEDWLLSQATT